MQVAQDPSEFEAAEAAIVEQCPDLEERTALLNRLLATADAANAIAPNAWAVTLFANGFRLNVGQVEAVVFADGELRVNLSAAVGTAPCIGPTFAAAGYSSLPQPLCAFVGSLQQYLPLASAIEPAHMRFVQLASTGSSGVPRKGTPFKRSHCEGLIQYARAVQVQVVAGLPASKVSGSGIAMPNEAGETEALVEGAVREVTLNVYERNRVARTRCIEAHGHECAVCGLDFGLAYGPAMEGFIHVHHIKALASIGAQYEVNPIEDLRPVCPNCHAVIHMVSPPRSIEEVKAMLSSAEKPNRALQRTAFGGR